MGWSRFECDDPRDRPLGDYYSDTQDGKQTLCWHWNPTTDLNQLRMCYEAAEKSYVVEEESYTFGVELEVPIAGWSPLPVKFQIKEEATDFAEPCDSLYRIVKVTETREVVE